MNTSRSRIPQLDLLRGIAVLMVIVHHYPYFHFLYKIGWAGVDLFFVLSGFLISGLLFTDWKKHGRFSIGRFFIRRGFKIYPAFYVFLLTTAAAPVMTLARGPKGEMFRRFAAECFFMQDYFDHLWRHTWSLAVEEQFYILLPVLLLLLSKLWRSRAERGFNLVPIISIALLAGCLAIRLHAHASTPEELQFPLHFRVDSLFAGVALGYWFHFRGESFRAFSRWWLLPASLVLLAPLAFFGYELRTLPFVFTCNTLAFGLLLCWILPRTAIRVPLIEKIGFHSYSIYLWHLLVTLVTQLFPVGFFMFCVNIAACCGAGAYMGNAVERRVLSIRERLFPADVAPSDASTPQPAVAESSLLLPSGGVFSSPH